MDLQFYPTPKSLAIRACSKFSQFNISRLLEPSGGRGDLIAPFLDKSQYFNAKQKIDCIELDLDNQAILRSKGVNVIDADFMKSSPQYMYSHIVMNPPFNVGADHFLKAWGMLYSGELVAILNAETVRKTGNRKSAHIRRLIEDHGSVEFLEEEFTTEETMRKTTVEIALIYMKKTGDVVKDYFTDLKQDDHTGAYVDVEGKQELTLPQSTISNAVAAFNAAVSSMKKEVIASAEASYYLNLIGGAVRKEDPEQTQKQVRVANVQDVVNERYQSIKESAWRHILNSTEFRTRLSSTVYEQLETNFKEVQALEFTASNIYGFLLGLIEGHGEMNTKMCCDVFDWISQYHTENRAYYRGWKSNDKHREGCYRLKMTRFIIHASGYNDYTMDYRIMNKLLDLDKAFSLLAGKNKTDNGVFDIFSTRYKELQTGNRFTTEYFEVRYYRGAQTIHFFPKDKTLVDRLNRLVGRQRNWLPPEDKKVSDNFWLQYDKAEKITDTILKKGNKVSPWNLSNEDGYAYELHEKACAELKIDLSGIGLEN